VVTVERVQTGVRLERNLVKVLKGLAEYLDLSLAELLEGIVLHSFEGISPFGDNTHQVIHDLSSVYGLTLTAADSHNLKESDGHNT
jgi:predicted DNA-binding ribbon-helix-helix protein